MRKKATSPDPPALAGLFTSPGGAYAAFQTAKPEETAPALPRTYFAAGFAELTRGPQGPSPFGSGAQRWRQATKECDPRRERGTHLGVGKSPPGSSLPGCLLGYSGLAPVRGRGLAVTFRATSRHSTANERS